MNLLSAFLRSCFWISDFFKGSLIAKPYREISKINQYKRGYQHLPAQYLENILKHAVNNCAFYKDYDYADINSFPIVSKQVLQQNHDGVFVPEDKNPHYLGFSYFIQKTSGSTGTPFAVPQDRVKRLRRISEIKYFNRIVGFNSHDKLVQLRIWTGWQSKGKKQAFWENIVPFDISNLNESNLKTLCDTIIKEKAKCLRGYASSFDLLARYVGDNNIKLPSVKIIIAGSETLYDSTRELVKRNIGCNIISQYANEENGILAQERLNDYKGGFYLNHASYYFEVLKLDSDEPAEYGEIGRLVITDLFNYAFPIIRYDNGDNCVMELDNATGKPYISQLFGRRLDMIYNSQGDPIFPMTLARILKNYDDQISQWQFIQKDQAYYQLKLSIKEGKEFIAKEEVLSMLKDIMGNNSNIEVVYVDDIPVLNSGKRKSVVNEWKK